MSLINADNYSTATTLTDSNTFAGLFYGNTGLTDASGLLLPATTLAEYCYAGMFNGCANLTKAPELPATTLAVSCYYNMFKGCTALTTAPALPATALESQCYESMFEGCSKLTTAPILPATKLERDCYYYMFNGCSKLSAVTCLAANISATDCTTDWLEGVAATGNFTKASGMTSWGTGASGIPSGWTIANY